MFKGRFPGSSTRLRRWTALVSILASVAALSVAPAVPAAAKVTVPADTSLDFQIYLANASSYGPYEAALGYIDVKAPNPGVWYLQPEGGYSGDGISGPAWEFEIADYSGNLTGLCMGDTVAGGWVVALPCGANGTVWVSVSNGDGLFLYNRFFLNRGSQYVLVDIPNSSYSAFIDPPSAVGGAIFGRWGWRSCNNQCTPIGG